MRGPACAGRACSPLAPSRSSCRARCSCFRSRRSSRDFHLAVLAIAALTAATRGVEVAVPTALAALCIAHVRARRIPTLAFVGAISYSLFLIHVPIGGRVVNLGFRYADTAPAQAL